MKLIKKARGALAAASTLIIGKMAAVSAFAEEDEGGLLDSKLVTGTQKLLEDLTSWLIGLCLTVGIAAVVYCLIRRSTANEADALSWKKRAITAGICGVAGALVGGILKAVSHYYL